MAVVVSIVSKFNDRELKRAIRSMDDFRRVSKIAGDGIAGNLLVAGRYMDSVGQKAMATGSMLTRNVSLPLAAVGYASVKSAANFETAMNQVQVATGATGDQLKKMSDLALKMGADTIFSAGDAADAMLELSKAGMTPAEISAGALKSTLDLAAASGMALADAAVVAGAGMNTFGLSAQDSSQIVDALAGAANASAADLPDLAQALQQVGQQAVASGFSLQETTGALAAFADAGVRGSDAGTSLKVFLQRLVPQSKQAREAMKKLGLDFFDAQGNMKPLTAIAGELQDSFKGLTQEQRLAAMQTIFGSDATRAANILFTQGADGIGKYVEASTKQGAAADMAAARMKGLNGALEQMRGSVETAGIKIGQALQPTIEKVAGVITDLTNKFTALDPKVQTTIVTIGAIVAAIGPLLWIGGALVSGLGKLIYSFVKVGQAFMWLSKLFMANPWLLLIAAVIAVAYLIYKHWDDIKAFLSRTWETIKTTASNFWNALKAGFQSLVSGIANFFVTLKNNIVNVITTVGVWLFDHHPLVMLYRAVAQYLPTVVNWFKGLPSRLITAVGNIAETFKSIGSNIVTGIKNGILAGWGSFKSWFMGMIGSPIQWAKEKLHIASPSKEFIKIGNFITAGLAKGIENTKNVKKAMNKLAKEVLDGANESLKKFKDHAQEVVDFAKQTQESMRSNAGLGSLLNGDEPPTTDSVRAYLTEKVAMFKSLASKVEKLRSAGLPNSFLQDIINAGPEGGNQLADAIMGGGSGFISELQGLDKQLNAASKAIGGTAAQSEYGMTVGQAQGVLDTAVKVEAGAVVINVGAGTSSADAQAMKDAVTKAVQQGLADLAKEYKKRKKK